MANLAGVVQQLRKERDLAAKTLQQLDAALAALNGTSSGTSGRRGRLSVAALSVVESASTVKKAAK